MSDLYFILNPTLGIIKIGVSTNLAARVSALEHACGVPLTVLRSDVGAGEHEHDLHVFFHDRRLRGEWFAPSVALLELIDGPESIEAFVRRVRPAIAKIEATIQAEVERAKAERDEATQQYREEIARLQAEQKRVQQERAAKRKKLRDARIERDRLAAIELAESWASRGPSALKIRLIDPALAGDALERRGATMTAQRARNAALIGTTAVVTSSSP